MVSANVDFTLLRPHALPRLTSPLSSGIEHARRSIMLLRDSTEERSMSLAGRLPSLMPVWGLLIATALLFYFSPADVMPRVLAVLVVFLAGLWLLLPVAYDRLQGGMGRVLQGVASLFTLLVLLAAYFLLLTPVALFLRWGGRDSLNRQLLPPAAGTAWSAPQSRQYDEEFFRAQF
jgi:hypothetical protein